MNDKVDHPDHYGGKDNPYEVIKIIEHFGLGFHLGNLVKYVLRAGKKDPAKHLEDLEKARWYLDREIQRLRVSAPAKDAVKQKSIEAVLNDYRDLLGRVYR